jgi:hypothetical protein
MISCPNNLEFSPDKANRRQRMAQTVLGEAVMCRVIALALFLLGANRKRAAAAAGISINTFLSFLTRFGKLGIDALRDRREKPSVLPAAPPPIRVQATRDDAVIVALGDKQLVLREDNPAQKRVVLLTLADAGLVSTAQVAQLLGCTDAHARLLRQRLVAEDVSGVIDQRRGQMTDYRVSSDVKTQIILCWAANAVTGRKVSGNALAADLHDDGLELPARTIRHHLKKLGLSGSHHRLTQLIDTVKKGS